MKRFSAILISSLVICAILTACSAAGKTADAESLKGFWEIDPSSKTGFDAVLSLEDEGVAELVLSDAYLEGEWKADGSQATITFDDDQVANIYVSGSNLILGDESGSKLVFIKSDIEKYYEASGDSGSTDSADDSVEKSDGIEIVEEDIKDITPVSVADDKVVKIEVTGKGTDYTSDPGYRLSITNKTDKTIFVVADDLFKVDGHEIEAGLGDVIDAGQTVETFMYFTASDLGGGIDKLKDVKGVIAVGDDESSKELGKYDFSMD